MWPNGLLVFFIFFLDETETFLKAYDIVDQTFEETKLTHRCMEQLKKNHVVTLIGKQGSGKTLTAVHIMKSNDYKRWTKLKVTSWDDLLAFEIPKNTFVYIDNIFDGYMYRHELQKWWCSLCFFYFQYIHEKHSTRLFITAKDGVIENACKHIKADLAFLDRFCFVKENSFPLNSEERGKILEMQMELAHKMKNITRIVLTKQFTDIKETTNSDIGFPLCAHLYAFERISTRKGIWIFQNPRIYVRSQIAAKIENDKSRGVMTLFLILLFYPYGSKNKINLKYKDSCERFWKKNCPRELETDIKPLCFENLYERAEELENTILIKHAMHEFQHQIYLEGVIDYFFIDHFDAAVKHFPLHILRTYGFQDISDERLQKLNHRLIEECFRNAIAEVLSCKIFEEPKLEQKFGEKLLIEENLNHLLLGHDNIPAIGLPIIFWANKYRREKLSKMLWNFFEKSAILKQDKLNQFFIGRFGICCADDESYITSVIKPIEEKDFKSLVCSFRTSDGKNVLHIGISSENSDHYEHCAMRRILKNTKDVAVDEQLLHLAVLNTKSSRLLCILEILSRLNEGPNTSIELSTSDLLKTIKKGPTGVYWNLEWLVRICILLAYNEIQPDLSISPKHSTNKDTFEFEKLLHGQVRKQNEMTRIINKNIDLCKQSSSAISRDTESIGQIPFRGEICTQLKEAIKESIQILCNKDILGS